MAQQQRTATYVLCRGPANMGSTRERKTVFSFLYLKKIKISKIYVRFGKFQKYTTVALWGATGLKCNFFFLQICNEVLGEKKKRGPVAPPTGDRTLSPEGWATGPCRPLGGATAPPLFFLKRLRCKFEEKKLHFGPVALWKGDRGIFLKYFKTDIYF